MCFRRRLRLFTRHDMPRMWNFGEGDPLTLPVLSLQNPSDNIERKWGPLATNQYDW